METSFESFFFNCSVCLKLSNSFERNFCGFSISPNVALISLMVESERQSLYNFMVLENSYRQMISSFTTDSRTLIDHIYTNLIENEIHTGVLETYFSDHKAIWASLNM
jgi:hypothetical protein